MRAVYSVGSSFLRVKEISQGYALKLLELRLAMKLATSTECVNGERDASANCDKSPIRRLKPRMPVQRYILFGYWFKS